MEYSTIFCCLLLDFQVEIGTRLSLRDKRLFMISEVEITRVECTLPFCDHLCIRDVLLMKLRLVMAERQVLQTHCHRSICNFELRQN